MASRGGAGLCPLGTDGRMCGKGTKLCQGRVRPGIGKIFWTVRVAKGWKRLSSKVVDAQCLSVFKRHLDNALNNLL